MDPEVGPFALHPKPSRQLSTVMVTPQPQQAQVCRAAHSGADRLCSLKGAVARCTDSCQQRRVSAMYGLHLCVQKEQASTSDTVCAALQLPFTHVTQQQHRVLPSRTTQATKERKQLCACTAC